MIQNIVRWHSNRLDGTVVAHCLGTPGQTKVSGDRQRETTHEICCLAAECLNIFYQIYEQSRQKLGTILEAKEMSQK